MSEAPWQARRRQHRQPLTPGEEPAAREHLRQEALALLRRLEHTDAVLAQELRNYVAQSSGDAAFSVLASELNGGRSFRRDTQSYALGEELLEVLNGVRSLEQRASLPEPLGAMTPGNFLDHIRERPQALRDLLLSIPDENLSREDNLLLMLNSVAGNLTPWNNAPSLVSTPESAPRRDFYDAVAHALRQLSNSLDMVGKEQRKRYLGMLRWRLERCEDSLELFGPWGLQFWNWDFVDAIMKLMITPWEERRTRGDAPLDGATWDALLESLNDLWARWYEVLNEVNDERERSDAEEAFRELLLRGASVASTLEGLEREGFLGLPREMRKAFVERALLEQAPLLAKVLQ